MVHKTYIIEGEGALVDENSEETPLGPGDFALVKPRRKTPVPEQGVQPVKMICGVPKEFELLVIVLFHLPTGHRCAERV